MGTVELVLLLISAVLISSVLDKMTKRISTPLFQIALGVVIVFVFKIDAMPVIEPEMFLLVFIAPLLFNEANHIDKLGFWKNKRMILSLALGLVVAITLAVGFALNAIVPAIGLAMAFALGAALGPTDAVAVTSLASVAKLTKKQETTLAGECLINDASGLVAFQFAVIAATTGAFSIVDAGASFLILFFGGIAIGIIIGVLLNFVSAFVNNNGYASTTFHVLFEVAIPFAVYIVAEHFHVSGILAVVACALVYSPTRKQSGVAASKTNIMSTSVWDAVSFTLNGMVFVLLGALLPSGMMLHTDGGASGFNTTLIVIALIVTAIVILVRFLWALFMERCFGSADRVNGGLLRHAAILSFAGAKGAVTLSIILTLPLGMANREELIFIASVVIVATLLLANFVVPVLAPADEEESENLIEENKKYIRILRRVMEKLSEDAEQASNVYEKAVYQTVLNDYSGRINDVKNNHNIGDTESVTYELRKETLKWQQDYAEQLKKEGKADKDVVEYFIDQCEVRIAKSSTSWTIKNFWFSMKTWGRATLKMTGLYKYIKTLSIRSESAEFRKQLDELHLKCQYHVIERLTKEAYNRDKSLRPEQSVELINEYRKSINATKTATLSVTAAIKSTKMINDVKLRAFAYEQDLINEAYLNDELDRRQLNKFRRRTATMQLDVSNEL